MGMAGADRQSLGLGRPYVRKHTRGWVVLEIPNSGERFPQVDLEGRLGVRTEEVVAYLAPVVPGGPRVRRAADRRIQLEDAAFPVEEIEELRPLTPSAPVTTFPSAPPEYGNTIRANPRHSTRPCR